MIAVALLGKILRLQLKTLLTVLAATVDVYFGTLIALLIRYYKELHLRTIDSVTGKMSIWCNKNKTSAGGVRTHADIRPLELKSNALTTRPPHCYNWGS